MSKSLLVSSLLISGLIVGCGGGGGGGNNQTIGSGSSEPEPNPPSIVTTEPAPTQPEPAPTETEPAPTETGITRSVELDYDFVDDYIEVGNFDESLSWYANLQVDLPDDGDYGLTVTRPLNGKPVAVNITISPYSNYILSNEMKEVLGIFATSAYMQWSRHLTIDPGPLELQIGEIPSSHCHGAVACYRSDVNKVILGEQWLIDNDFGLKSGWRNAGNIYSELFWVISHEAGHQFGYYNPNGIADGCGGGSGCHAPYGSGSVMSYDLSVGNNARYEVTKEDIDLIPGGLYNDSPLDLYEVYADGETGSGIEKYGVWLGHTFSIDGIADPQFNNWFHITDMIASGGWINGTPTNNIPTGNTTYTGDFLGTDMNTRFLGSLIRADVNLRYTFSSNKMNLNIDNFEAHYGVQQDGRVEKR